MQAKRHQIFLNASRVCQAPGTFVCPWKLTAGCLLLLACRSVGRNSSVVKMIAAEYHPPMQESQPAERLDNSRCTLHVSSLR